MNWEIDTIIRVAVIGAYVILTIVGLILSQLKNSKNKAIAAKAEGLLAITTAAKKYVVKAETLVGFDGMTKKEWVETKIQQYALNNNITFDEAEVSQVIEDLIYVTNRVNSVKVIDDEVVVEETDASAKDEETL